MPSAVPPPERLKAGRADLRAAPKWALLPWALVVVFCGALLWSWRPPAKVGTVPMLSIAVLPFTAAATDPELAGFTDAFVQQLTTAMARADAFRVASRVESDRIRGKADLTTVGKRLRVDAVLEGSTQRAGDGVHLIVQLLNCADGYSIWSQSYDSLPGASPNFRSTVRTSLFARCGPNSGACLRGG